MLVCRLLGKKEKKKVLKRCGSRVISRGSRQKIRLRIAMAGQAAALQFDESIFIILYSSDLKPGTASHRRVQHTRHHHFLYSSTSQG